MEKAGKKFSGCPASAALLVLQRPGMENKRERGERAGMPRLAPGTALLASQGSWSFPERREPLARGFAHAASGPCCASWASLRSLHVDNIIHCVTPVQVICRSSAVCVTGADTQERFL